jgi:3-oxoacyl-[acyl-carrier-protein] synthase-1
MTPLPITSYTITTALGAGLSDNWRKLAAGQTALRPCDFFGIRDLQAWVGEVAGVDGVALPAPLARFDCRNNRLAWLGLQQDGFLAAVDAAVARYGALRVAVFMGTSTAGIHQTERAYRELDPDTEALPDWYCYETTHNCHSIAEFTRVALGLEGISSAVSTACSSSAKVFASARRAMASGLCDAAVVGGVDSLCLTTLYGFNALQLVSPDKCRPCAPDRAGISIGEAAGFALLERDAAGATYALLGYGESSDAHHMSSPHPEGEGARLAMLAALHSAGLEAADIDYINLHGTGTVVNDLAESKAVARLFGDATPCSSTKGWTGHTLGAAGIVEAVLGLLCIEHGFMPQTLNAEQLDPALQANILLAPRSEPVHRVLSNSFGFGGSNCSLILGARP